MKNKIERKEKLNQRQIAEKKALKYAENERRNKYIFLEEIKTKPVESTVLKQQFIEKLRIWTNNFTDPILSMEVVRSENVKAPKFSGIEEYEMYEKFKSLYDDCLIRAKDDVKKAWELFFSTHINPKQSIDDKQEER